MNKTKRIVSAAVVTAIGLSGLTAGTPAFATPGNTSLASVLTAKSSFDNDGTNYDIVTAAVVAVLTAKPNSPVAALADGNVPVTAFIPNDQAFENLVTQLTGTAPVSEQATFDAVAGLGIDTVEAILEYHVVPGTTITSADALNANGAVLPTVLADKNITVGVSGMQISLNDYDKLAPTPKVILSQVDINAGNFQIAHGIDAVLLPSQVIPYGTKSLASVLTAKNSFDNDHSNFDIVTAAVKAVLKAKPNSPVGVLADGSTAVTAFIPTDAAFLKLAKALTGKKVTSEKKAFAIVASLGIKKVEKILLYHVVPGATIMSPDALKANGAVLATALSGKYIHVSVDGTKIALTDYSRLTNPVVVLSAVDINKGNLQVAHGIDDVLLPTK